MTADLSRRLDGKLLLQGVHGHIDESDNGADTSRATQQKFTAVIAPSDVAVAVRVFTRVVAVWTSWYNCCRLFSASIKRC